MKKNPMQDILNHVNKTIALKQNHESQRAEMIDRLVNYADGIAAELTLMFGKAGIPLVAIPTNKINSTETVGETMIMISIQSRNQIFGNLFSIDLPSVKIEYYSIEEIGVHVWEYQNPVIMEGFDDRRKKYSELTKYKNLEDALSDEKVIKKLRYFVYNAVK